MSTWDYEVVSASYARCLESGSFFDSFYATLLAKSPEIPPLFAKTDFEKQKRMVRKSIAYVLTYASGKEYGEEALEEIAEVHSSRQHSIAPTLYQLWIDSFCETVKKFDPQWTQQLEDLWRRFLQQGADFMISRF